MVNAGVYNGPNGPVTIHLNIQNAHTYPFHGSVGATGKGILIGMLSAFGSAAVIFIACVLVYFFRYTPSGRIILDRLGRPGEYDDEQSFLREEAQALEDMDDLPRTEYLRAKAFIQANPPESAQTDISLSQFLAIQEKGVSAWEFEPELEIANCFVEGRTEIEFFDAECSVQSNLPIPKQNEVYYWEAKIYEKPESTLISVGMTTKPYPLFRLPGLHKCSLAYTSSGERRYNQPFHGTQYGPAYIQGDVIGVGYRPRSGTVFFTRNGRKLDDVAHGLKAQNFFPTVGANGPCHVHVNFGQLGFVFIEANVKKWGLAPMMGSLAPPPPYGSEQGSILLEGGRDRDATPTASYVPAFFHPGHGRSISAQVRLDTARQPLSPGPHRSPTDISLAALSPTEARQSIAAAMGGGDGFNVGSSSNSAAFAHYNQSTSHGNGISNSKSNYNRNNHNADLSSRNNPLDHPAFHSSEQAATAARVLGQHNLDVSSALDAYHRQQQQHNQQKQYQNQQQDLPRFQQNNQQNRFQQGAGEGNDGSAGVGTVAEDEEHPPPEYESPEHTPTATENGGGSVEGYGEDGPLLAIRNEREDGQNGQNGQRRDGERNGAGESSRDSPPIPSYDAAVSGGSA